MSFGVTWYISLCKFLSRFTMKLDSSARTEMSETNLTKYAKRRPWWQCTLMFGSCALPSVNAARLR